MSDTVYWLVFGAGLALASYSVSRVVSARPARRKAKALTLALSAGLGVLLGGWVLGWDSWPGGLLAGLAVVEVGPTVAAKVRGKVRGVK